MSGLNTNKKQRLLEWKYNSPNYMLFIKDNLNITQIEKKMMERTYNMQVLTERNLFWL